MITKQMIQAIKQINVSKDCELTKQRVGELWKKMNSAMKKQISDYGLSESSVLRSRAKGNMSVKLAAVLALISGVDPFYLTAEAHDSSTLADEERVRKFISDHHYWKILEFAPAGPKGSEDDGKVKANTEAGEAGGDFAEEPAPVEKGVLAETEREVVTKIENVSIQEFADAKMGHLSDAELNAINEMPVEDLQALLNNLVLQAKYSEKAKNLIGLLRLILVR